MQSKAKIIFIRQVVLWAGFLFPAFLQATLSQPNFKHFSTQDGLSESNVISIYQDHLGFMWFGTQNGLNKYDGYEFTCYRNDPNDSLSLSDNEILVIYEDRQNNLWIGTNSGGLNLYERMSDSFMHFQHNESNPHSLSDNSVRAILEDRYGHLWIGTYRGLNLFDRKNQHFINHGDTIQLLDAIQGLCIETLCEDEDGDIWIGTTRLGTFCYHISSKEYENFSAGNGKIGSDFIKEIICDRYNRIWIGTEAFGLILYIKNQNRFIQFKNDSDGSNSLAHNCIHALLYDQEGSLWIGTENSGLSRFVENKQDITKSGFIHYIHDVNNPQSISNNTPCSIYEDVQGNLWVGTYRGGLNVLLKYHKNFLHFLSEPNNPVSLSHNTVQAIFEDRENQIWIGTDGGGLNLFLPAEQTFKHFRHGMNNPQSLISDNVLAICEEDGRYLWVGTWSGLDLFDRKTGEFQHFKFKIKKDRIIGLNNVVYLYKDKKRQLWIATFGGLVQFDHHKNIVRIFGHNEENPRSLSNDNVQTMVEDSEGNLWIGTLWGLNRLPSDERTASYPDSFITYLEGGKNGIKGNRISVVFEDSQNRLWIGTNKGLNLYHGKTESFSCYLIQDSLPSNWIKSILEDDNGHLWLSTQNGLSRFDPDSGCFRNYDYNDGLQDNEFTSACCKTRSGKLYLGGINGFNIFDPKEIRDNAYIPPVVITDFLIFNTSVPMAEVLVDPKEDSGIPHLQLSYRQNVFSFEFSALDYTTPSRNQYAYIMEGFDNQWTYTNARRRFASYTNLPHGHYRFHVKASNNDGLWNEQGVSVNLTLKPPYWKSSWAYIVYFLLLVLMIYGYHRYYNNMVQLRTDLKIEKLEKEKAIELEKMKTNFFTNITHEFKTPLTLIMVPLQELIQNSNKQFRQRLKTIQKNSQHLLRMVNQVLDFNKIETGHLSIEKQMVEIISFLEGIIENLMPLASEKHINIHLAAAINQCHLPIDPEKMEMVITNLLSNAIKFTPGHGKISVSVRTPTIETIDIVVEDSGPGIEKDHLPFIFTRFYHIDINPSQKGTGIGLTLSKELVELHDGTLSAENTDPPPGARFTIRLPLLTGKLTIPSQVRESVDDLKEEGFVSPPMLEKNKPILLIVEDNRDLRECLRDEMGNDYVILEAANGVEGFNTAIHAIPDMVISDIMMAEMDGLNLCSKLKKHELTSHIPVILLTAKTTEMQQLEGLKTGADDYITKPFNLTTLKVKISNLIEIRNRLRKQFSQEIRLEATDIVVSDMDAEFIKKAIQIVDDHISEPDFTVDKFSSLIGVSRSQLLRKLKGLTDETPQEFIRMIRLKQAVHLLVESKLTITEICYATGFNFPSHFAWHFRAAYGVNPLEYRKSHQISAG